MTSPYSIPVIVNVTDKISPMLREISLRLDRAAPVLVSFRAAIAGAFAAACARKRPLSRRALLFPWRRS